MNVIIGSVQLIPVYIWRIKITDQYNHVTRIT